MSGGRLYFEPWGMGDALIALAVMRLDPRAAALGCSPRWIPLLRTVLAAARPFELLPIDLPYTTRRRAGRLEMGTTMEAASRNHFEEVLSIRGDLRDFVAARRAFPTARRRFSGWVRFAARRSRILDLPFVAGLSPVVNRYEAWCDLAGLRFADLLEDYGRRRGASPPGCTVAIHVGAQWRSRQYPHVVELARRLQGDGFAVSFLAGPDDALPRAMREEQVRRVVGADLSDALSASGLVICNDSGPMHLAALLGRRTLVVARASNISEWLPPGVRAIPGVGMPAGYRPDRRYATDVEIEGWPDPDDVALRLHETAA